MITAVEEKRAADVYNSGAAAGLLPDPDFTVSEWSDEYRILPQKSSSEPGRWRTSRTPYLREIMDCLSPSSPDKEIIFMKGSQVGGTEAATNWVGSVIHLHPAPMMVVQPNLDLGKRWSRQRLSPMLDETPVLRGRVREARERDSGTTILSKDFEGGMLIIAGAQSAPGLRSAPIAKLFLDEIDAYPADVSGEGDPCSLAEKRTTTFSRRKIFKVSTPTEKGVSRIEDEYNRSDQRLYFVPCVHCKFKQSLTWKQVTWEPGKPQAAAYRCARCRKLNHEYHKTEMFAAGEWRAKYPDEDRPAGFHLSGLYSPVGWLSWGEIAVEFLKAKQDRSLLKTWTNTRLGEAFEEKGERINETALYSRREDYGPKIPADALVLTAGADVQGDRIEAEIVAWGLGEESWGIDYQIFEGSPVYSKVWEKLNEWLLQTWEHESGAILKVSAACIDAGAYSKNVTDFVKSCSPRRVYAIKGSSEHAQPLITRANPKKFDRARAYIVGTDTAKDIIFARLKQENPGFGYIHFPKGRESDSKNQEIRGSGYDLEYFRQLTAEKKVTRFTRGTKRNVYEQIYERNEALDVRVYNAAALAILRPNFEKIAENIKAQAAERKAGGQEKGGEDPIRAKDKQKNSRGPRRGFVNKWRRQQ